MNIDNGNIYIGSTSSGFKKRWREHRHQLRQNRHCNKHLQSAWNKYGSHCFIFEVIERTTPEDCINREQFWLDFMQPQYNKRTLAYSNKGIKWSRESKQKLSRTQTGTSKKPHSEETKVKMRLAHKGKKLSKEHKQKLSIAHKGKVISDEHRKKLSQATKNWWHKQRMAQKGGAR